MNGGWRFIRRLNLVFNHWKNYHSYQIRFTKDQVYMIFTVEIARVGLLQPALIRLFSFSLVKQVFNMVTKTVGIMKTFSVTLVKVKMVT